MGAPTGTGSQEGEEPRTRWRYPPLSDLWDGPRGFKCYPTLRKVEETLGCVVFLKESEVIGNPWGASTMPAPPPNCNTKKKAGNLSASVLLCSMLL